MSPEDRRALVWAPFTAVPYEHRLATTVHPPLKSWAGSCTRPSIIGEQAKAPMPESEIAYALFRLSCRNKGT